MVSRFRRARPFRRARRLLSLTMVGGLALPLVATNTAVAVTIDGAERDLQTYAATVGDVLEELDVDLAAADEVSPPRGAAVTDGLEIEISRAITVDVRVDGEHVHRVVEPVGSVAGVLDAVDLDVREEDALISPRWKEPVEDGDVIDVVLPTEVELTVDGETREVGTHVATVEDLLLDEAVELADEDLVSPGPDTPLADAEEVVVERVDVDEVVEEVVLERDEQRRETDDLEQGTTRVEDEGRDGVRHDHYRVELVDGDEVERELTDREVVTDPRDRVVLVGTREPEPEPEPEPDPEPEPSAPGVASGGVWDDLARCESGGNWSHSGGMHHGGLQFHPDTWNRHKPGGYPQYAYEASREQQIVVGERVQASQGWAAWPHCSRAIGVR